MAGFMDAFRQGRNEARSKRGAPPLPGKHDREVAEHKLNAPYGDAVDDAGVEADLPDRETEVAGFRRLLADVTALAERQKTDLEQQAVRIAELEGVSAPLVAVLLMPGVKTGLLNRFHPDKHPEADDAKRVAYNEALRVINEAYAIIDHIQASG